MVGAMSKLYTVWCGGVEVNDWYFDNYDDAAELAQRYADDGYDDIHVVTINDEKISR
jgi:hypothetical protein